VVQSQDFPSLVDIRRLKRRRTSRSIDARIETNHRAFSLSILAAVLVNASIIRSNKMIKKKNNESGRRQAAGFPLRFAYVGRAIVC
jgi:hypothetical protein